MIPPEAPAFDAKPHRASDAGSPRVGGPQDGRASGVQARRPGRMIVR